MEAPASSAFQAPSPKGEGKRNDIILRSEVLRQMDTGEPFHLEFVTADRKRGTGGELVKVINWTKQKKDPVQERKTALSHNSGRSRPSKTFIISNPHNKIQHPISVHVRLLQFFNGKRIING